MGMARPALQIKVKPSDRRKLKDLLDGGIQQVRVTLRAVALLQLSGGASAPRISEVLPLTPQAIRKIGHRYEQGGFDCAIYEKARPGPAEVLDDTQKQRIIAMVCSDPSRWLRTVDGALGRRGGRQAPVGPGRRQGDNPNLAAPPRPQAVAGKKCGGAPG